MVETYDVVVLGGGIGGYSAAIRGKQLGLSVAVVEQDKLGGTCLHRGCIPTKSLLHTANLFQATLKGNDFGVISENVKLDFGKTQAKKQLTVDQLHNGLKFLFKRHEIPIYYGYGTIQESSIKVIDQDQTETQLRSRKAIIVATGSQPKELVPFKQNGRNILNTNQILELTELPKSIVIIGGGVVGVEFASLLSDLGVKVTIVEQQSSVLIDEDLAVQQGISTQLRNRGIDIIVNTTIDSINENDPLLEFSLTVNGAPSKIEASHCLVSIGRNPNTEGIGLDNTVIQLDQGFIKVDDHYRTNDPHFYAIGDVIGHPMLAHVAMYQGLRAVEHIAGKESQFVNNLPIPYCIYTEPEIGRVGLTEQEAKIQGYNVKVGKFELKANSKAVLSNTSSGFIKVIIDAESDDLLGAHLMGAHATELVSIFGIGILMNISGWELTQSILPHPTVAEAILEAVYDIQNQAIHS